MTKAHELTTFTTIFFYNYHVISKSGSYYYHFNESIIPMLPKLIEAYAANTKDMIGIVTAADGHFMVSRH